jgi:electron transfer flavoprotein alpha/beta subunit
MKRSQERIAVILRSVSTAIPGSVTAPEENSATLEAALTLASKKPVHLSAIGVFAPSDDASACQEALEKGCDEVLSIAAPVPFDFFGEALLLRAAIESTGTTMVMCGDYGGDFEGASMGAALAFMLDIPCISGVLDCNFKGDDYLLTRRTDTGIDQFRCPRPALLSFVDHKPAPARASRATKARAVESRAASALLGDLTVLYSRSPLAMHGAYAARPEATELLSDPKSLLCRLREAKLWDND